MGTYRLHSKKQRGKFYLIALCIRIRREQDMKNRALSKALSLVVAVALMLVTLPDMTAAAEGTDSGTSLAYSVTGFTALQSDVAAQNVPPGTSMSTLTLPDTLTATGITLTTVTPPDATQTAQEETITIPGVTWQAAPEYEPDTAGTYIFTAVLPERYSLAGGVDVPVITVEVTAATGAQTGHEVTFDIPLNESGETAFFLTEGVPVTDADLLAGVSAVDENGEPVIVTVKDAGGLDMQNPVLKRAGILPEPYVITYEAAHPVTGEIVAAARECYVTLGAMWTMANTYTWSSSTVPTGFATGDTITVSTGASGTLTIPDGVTELTINGNNVTINGSISISGSNNVTLNLNNITINSNYALGAIYSFKAQLTLNITGTVNMNGANGGGKALESDNGLIISGVGTLYATGGNGIGANSFGGDGIYVPTGVITITNNVILIANGGNGGDSTSDNSSGHGGYGVYVRNTITNNGTIIASGGNGGDSVNGRGGNGGYGIRAGAGSSIINNGTITASGGNGGDSTNNKGGDGSSGISAEGSITNNSNAVDLTATGGTGGSGDPAGSDSPAANKTVGGNGIGTSPVITTQPNNSGSINAGQNATFTISASGNPTPAYQWQVSINSGVSWDNISNGSIYTGVTTNTLVITGVTLSANSNQYRCIATNSLGTVTSTAATLTVIQLVTFVTVSGEGNATSITTKGGTLQMSAAIDPSDATDKSVTWSITSGSNFATISSSGLLTATADGTVTVRATANDGTGIYGEKAISISGQILVTSIAVAGENNVDTITAKDGTLRMLANVQPDNASNKSVTWSISSGSGATIDSDTGILTATTDGTVKVRATAKDSSGKSGEVTITISGQLPSTITKQPSPQTKYAGTGEIATFSVTATGTPTLTYQWQIDAGSGWDNVSNGGIYSGAATNTLTLTGVTLAENNNLYRCVAKNTHSTASSNGVALTVIDKSALDALIISANSIKDVAGVGTGNGQYTQTAYETFAAAITTAKGVASTSAVSNTQVAVNTALSNLQAAISTFNGSVISVDSLGLTMLISTAMQKKTGSTYGDKNGDYALGQETTLGNAISVAQAVANNPNHTLTQVTDAINALQAAINNFNATLVIVNYTSLNDLISTCNTLHNGAAEGSGNGQYEASSKAVFKTAIQSAEGAAADNRATQTEINGAVSVLTAALNTFNSTVIIVGSSGLTALISTATQKKTGSTYGDKNGDYAPAQETALGNAISAAQAVADNQNRTQTEVTNAISVLQIAISNFNAALVVVNYTALNDLIRTCSALHDGAAEGSGNGQYEPGSKTVFYTTINSAKSVAADNRTTQAIVNGAVSVLTAARNTFAGKMVGVNYDVLNGLITQAQDKANNSVYSDKNGDYPASAKGALETAISAAQTVANNASATQTQVNTAVSALETAITTFNNMKITVTYQPLKDLLLTAKTAKADAIPGDGNEQTPVAAINALQAAIDAAQLTADDNYLSQATVNGAFSDLTAALSTFYGLKNTVDFNVIDTAIADAKAIRYENYTTATWDTLQTAITNAEAVRAKQYVTQTEADNAASVITAAVAGLLQNTSNNNSSSGASYTPPPTISGLNYTNTMSIPYSITGSNLTSNISAQNLRSIVDNAYKSEDGSKIVKISFNDISGSASLTKLTLTFDASMLEADEDVTFIIEMPFGVFIFTSSQMQEWFADGFGSYTITLEKSSLKVDIEKDGKSVVWNSLTPMARIGVPYNPKTDEATTNLTVTDQNDRVLPTSMYEKGMVYADIFAPGTYKAVVSSPAIFNDTADHWAKASIDYVTMTGLITASGNAYFPDVPITQGEYLAALGKLSGANVSIYKQSSFTDVSNESVYMPYIEWAVAKGIAQGIGDDMFAPDAVITHEQIAVMMANYAKSSGYTLPTVKKAAAFTDSAKISDWAKDAVTAMQKANIIIGKDSRRFDPQGSTTRAEAAAILHQFVENVISSRSAEGFSNSSTDLNKRVYYTQNGNALTGWQTINGARYYFSGDNVMHTGWLSIDKKQYRFYRNGKMIAGKWVQIGSKWYYFRKDGTLMTSSVLSPYK